MNPSNNTEPLRRCFGIAGVLKKAEAMSSWEDNWESIFWKFNLFSLKTEDDINLNFRVFWFNVDFFLCIMNSLED